MAPSVQPQQPSSRASEAPVFLRADALARRERILETAATLASERRVSMPGAGPANPSYRSTQRQLHDGERLILLTDGITQRRMENGETFGVDGLRHALESADTPTAASTAMAIQQAVTDCWREPLEDDGTVVVMAIE